MINVFLNEDDIAKCNLHLLHGWNFYWQNALSILCIYFFYVLICYWKFVTEWMSKGTDINGFLKIFFYYITIYAYIQFNLALYAPQQHCCIHVLIFEISNWEKKKFFSHFRCAKWTVAHFEVVELHRIILSAQSFQNIPLLVATVRRRARPRCLSYLQDICLRPKDLPIFLADPSNHTCHLLSIL